MRSTGDPFEEVRQRTLFAPDERVRSISAAAVGLAFLAGVAAVVVTILGSTLGFDALPVATVLGVTAGVLLLGLGFGVELWSYVRLDRAYHGEEPDPLHPDPTPVPERDAQVARERRAMLRRIEAQRAARNQRAASGGSVSSADAGRPSQGSSEATTEP